MLFESPPGNVFYVGGSGFGGPAEKCILCVSVVSGSPGNVSKNQNTLTSAHIKYIVNSGASYESSGRGNALVNFRIPRLTPL